MDRRKPRIEFVHVFNSKKFKVSPLIIKGDTIKENESMPRNKIEPIILLLDHEEIQKDVHIPRNSTPFVNGDEGMDQQPSLGDQLARRKSIPVKYFDHKGCWDVHL